MGGMVLGIALAVLYFWYHDWGSIWTTGRYRRRATIDVSSGGVSTGDARYLTKEIVGFEVRAPARSLPAARVIHRRPNVVFVGDAGAVLAATAAHELASGIAGGFASGQQVGAGAREAAQRDHESRSYMVSVRTTRLPGPEVLAGGLTADCAGALVDDLGAALASAEHLERTGAPGDEWKVSGGYDRRGLVSATTARIRLPELLFFGVFWWATPLIRMFKKKG